MISLTLNCGSSSAKYQVFDWDKGESICVGLVERIGEKISHIENESKGKEEYDGEEPLPTHKEAVEFILKITSFTDPDPCSNSRLDAQHTHVHYC